MQLPVERTPGHGQARSMSRRRFLLVAGGSTSLVLLAACSGTSAPAAPPPVKEEAAPPMRTMVPVAAPTMAPAAKPDPAPAQAAPAAGKPEPKGKFTYAFQTSISPSWMDPLENPPQVTPYNFQYLIHDAMLKHMPGKTFVPSLAESYEIAPDYKSATFKLRAGTKFHDGSPVTPADVKFTYENYKGASASVLKAKLERIDLPDDRTVKFFFKEPFVDFLMLYGSPASGAGWIVPKAYYEKVGPNGFKTAPIGAGPYRFVRQQAGLELETEAFTDYWRKVPSVKTIVVKGIPEIATRVAMLKTGEIDAAHQIQGELLIALRKEGVYRMTAIRSAATWLELMALDRPDHPLKDIRVRQAVSLAIDRVAVNEAEMAGLSPIDGNWIPEEYDGAIKRPVPPTDVAKARQLLAEAGVPDGFDVSALTPLPPYFSWGERLISQLRVVGIRTTMQQMERGAFYEKLTPGPNRVKGIVLQFSGAPGDAAARIRENAVCNGAFSGLCMPEVDDRMKSFDASTDPAVRKKLLDEVQAFLLDQYIMVPVARNVACWGIGHRVANKPDEIAGAIQQYPFIGPYEDVQVKDA